MARFANLKNRTPAPRVKVKVIQTGHEALSSAPGAFQVRYSIYQDETGRRSKLIPDLADEDGTILVQTFESGLFPLFRGREQHLTEA